MLKTDWPRALDSAARQVHPAHARMFRGLGFNYYWSAFQTEWATDTAFDSRQSLAAIYPQLVRGAIATFDSRSVMRFLGHRLYENHAWRDRQRLPQSPGRSVREASRHGQLDQGVRQRRFAPAHRDHDQQPRCVPLLPM